MKKVFILFTVILGLWVMSPNPLMGQSVAINNDGSTANASAMLDVKSTTKGMLIPRMTSAERTGIISPAAGLLVFDNQTASFWFYKSVTGWTELGTGGGGGTNYWNTNGTHIYNINTGNVGIGTSTPGAPLGFPNIIGNKIRFWSNGPNQDYGIGINSGVMQFFTAGHDKIAFGWGNANAFNEKLSIHTGTGLLAYPNTLGNKISFWRAGPNNDFGIGLNAGVLQFFTAGQDKIAFGWGNANNFIEKISFYTGSGQVGINTTNVTGGYQLAVNGKIRSKEVVVESGWADYVFDEKYKLKPLKEVENFIVQNKHLPGIPSAAEVEKYGLHLGDTQKRMMEKIEELMLYVIQLNKRIEELEKK